MSIYNMLYIPLKKKKVLSYHGIMRCCLVGLVFTFYCVYSYSLKTKWKRGVKMTEMIQREKNAMNKTNKTWHRRIVFVHELLWYDRNTKVPFSFSETLCLNYNTRTPYKRYLLFDTISLFTFYVFYVIRVILSLFTHYMRYFCIVLSIHFFVHGILFSTRDVFFHN